MFFFPFVYRTFIFILKNNQNDILFGSFLLFICPTSEFSQSVCQIEATPDKFGHKFDLRSDPRAPVCLRHPVAVPAHAGRHTPTNRPPAFRPPPCTLPSIPNPQTPFSGGGGITGWHDSANRRLRSLTILRFHINRPPYRLQIPRQSRTAK